MPAVEKKEFVIKHVFTDVMNMESNKMYHGNKENHFNIPWQINFYKAQSVLDDTAFHLYLDCSKQRGDNDWSILTETEIKLVPATGESLCKNKKHQYGFNTNCFYFLPAEVMKYLVDGDLTIEMHVEITEINGIKQNLRSFDESTKEFSDVVLIVEGERFHVCKMYLASQSSYFNSIFFGNFGESNKSEIELKDINKSDFQNFLEVIYAEPAIDDDIIDGILRLADMYDSKTAIRRCEEFLLKISKQSLKVKFDIAIKYRMDKLRMKCLSEVKTKNDLLPFVPEDSDQIQPAVWAELFQKLLSFK